MSSFTWEYPIIVVLAIAAGVWIFSLLTRNEREPLPEDFARHCERCKLKTTGQSAKDYRYCPFCAARYPSL